VTPPLDRFEWERLIRELELPSALKLTSYALGTYVNGDGRNAHPGIEGLVKATGLHRATVLRSLGRLEEYGLIKVVFRGGGKGVRRGMATVYELAAPVDNSVIAQLGAHLGLGP
jgi:DNA-binding transcriptional ArsR family regulator